MRGFDALFPWLFGALVVAFIVIFIASRIQQKKRTAALAALAQTMGFNFEGTAWGDPTCAPRLQTALFHRGHSQRFKNIMTGNFAGFPTSVFDYWFTTGGGKSSHTWSQTVFAFTVDLWLPVFEMRPENFVERISDAFTHKDIDFDSHPEFSQRYLLRGEDKEKVRELFTPALLTFLEGLPADKKWHTEGDGHTLVFYRSDATAPPEEIPSLLEETVSIAKTFLSCCGLKKTVF